MGRMEATEDYAQSIRTLGKVRTKALNPVL